MAKIKLEELHKKLKEKNAKWKAKETPIGLMDEEKRKRHLGIIKPKDAEELSADIELPGEEPLVELATEFDWRSSGKVTPVKDQGGCGSCASFGTVAVIESMVAIEKNQIVDLSEADLHFCSSHGASCDGWWHTTAFEQVKLRGVCDEICFPYASAFVNGNTSGAPSCKVCADRENKIVKIVNINRFTNNTELKNYISTTGPVAAVIAVYEDFYNYGSGVYQYITGTYQGLHCIVIIGYSEIEQCWICKNSWNVGWGDDGYFKLGYGEIDIDKYEKVGANAVILPNDIPSPVETEILTISPVSKTVTRNAGQTTFDVTANCEWTVSSNVSWCVLSVLNDIPTASYTANTTRRDRTALITFKSSTITRIVTIIQQKTTKKNIFLN